VTLHHQNIPRPAYRPDYTLEEVLAFDEDRLLTVCFRERDLQPGERNRPAEGVGILSKQAAMDCFLFFVTHLTLFCQLQNLSERVN
jgi:hypothetical protein